MPIPVCLNKTYYFNPFHPCTRQATRQWCRRCCNAAPMPPPRAATASTRTARRWTSFCPGGWNVSKNVFPLPFFFPPSYFSSFSYFFISTTQRICGAGAAEQRNARVSCGSRICCTCSCCVRQYFYILCVCMCMCMCLLLFSHF